MSYLLFVIVPLLFIASPWIILEKVERPLPSGYGRPWWRLLPLVTALLFVGISAGTGAQDEGWVFYLLAGAILVPALLTASLLQRPAVGVFFCALIPTAIITLMMAIGVAAAGGDITGQWAVGPMIVWMTGTVPALIIGLAIAIGRHVVHRRHQQERQREPRREPRHALRHEPQPVDEA